MAEWVAVGERLPCLGVGVLITDGKSIATAELRETTALWLTQYQYWTGYGFSGHEWEFEFRDEDVTHWQALPSLP